MPDTLRKGNMLDKDAIVTAMMRCIAPGGTPITDPRMVDENVKSLLGEFNIDPQHVFDVAAMILAGAVASGEKPEDTVIQSFVIGVAIGAQLSRMEGATHADY